MDPLNPDILYAGTEFGIYKTGDGTHSGWKAVNSGLTAGSTLFGVPIGPSVPGATELVIDPTNPATIYVTADDGISRSTDGGITWQSLIQLYRANFTAIAIDPSNPAILYAAHKRGISKSTDKGISWIPIFSGLGEISISALRIDASKPTTLYAATHNSGVLKSIDSGTTWFAINSGLTLFGRIAVDIADLVIDPKDPNTIYIAISGYGEGTDIYKSTNGGASWTAAGYGMGNVISLAIDSSNPKTLYAGTSFGTFKTTDGGANWVNARSGLGVLSVYKIVINSVHPTTVYAGTEGGVFKSINGGTRWSPVNFGIPSSAIEAVIIDPSNTTTIYVNSGVGGVFKTSNSGGRWIHVNSGITNYHLNGALAIDPSNPRVLYTGASALAGLFKSTNGGASWSPANSGLSGLGPRFLAIDPVNPANVYLVTHAGISKSTNGGLSWASSDRGLPSDMFASNSKLVIDPVNPAILYVSTFNKGIFKSSNAGTSWFAVNSGLVDPYVNDLAINPINTNNIYAATSSGLFVSNNAGSSWSPVAFGFLRGPFGTINGPVYVRAVAIDPQKPAVIYASVGGSVLRSVDAGASWTLGSLEPNRFASAIKALAIDPSNTSVIYAATFRGVFRSADSGVSWQSTSTNSGPEVFVGGIVNSATYLRGNVPVSPGSIAAVFGWELNDSTPPMVSSIGSDGKVPTSLGGVSVKINNHDAPIFYSSLEQLGVQIPFELAGQSSASMQVTVGPQTSPPTTIFLDSFAPGIFTANQQGTGIAAALHQDGSTPVSAQNPAHPNEVIAFFGTGLGVVTPALGTGVPAAGNQTVTVPTVVVGGVRAVVEFSGAAPNFVGLNQINVRIPESTRTSASIPVVLSIGGKESNSVTIPVGP